MSFTTDLPWPWSLSPVEAMQLLAHGYLPGFIGRLIVGLLVGLIIGLATRRGNPFAGVPVLIMAAVGWLLASQPLPLLAFVLVIYLTIATYRGAAGPRRSMPRTMIVLALRLIALVLTMITLTRPALLVRSEDRVPSVLVILLDASKSMTFKDAYNNQSRFDALRATLGKSEKALKRLQDENQVTVVMLGFGDRVVDWDANVRPDGPSSDYGGALAAAYQRFGSEPNLRGLLVLGDGADNGRRFNAIAEARRWKAVQCPLNSFAVGEPIDRGREKDIAISNLNVEPAPVFVKGRMIFKATVDAFGCENAVIEPTIHIEGLDQPLPAEKITVNNVEPDGDTKLPWTNNNELMIETTAPEKPGEYRVTLRIKPLPGEASVANNEVSTFVTVSKEGVSVLLIAPLDDETKFIRWALKADPRVRLWETTRQSAARPRGEEAMLFNFDRQAYDVIILRNVSAARLSAGNIAEMQKIRQLVTEKGTGLMMMGGFDSFGGSQETNSVGNWNNTPIGDLLPVELNVSGHITSGRDLPRTGLFPSRDGQGHYLLQLDNSPAESAKKWAQLNEKIDLRGANRLGRVKTGATLLATADPARADLPMLVSHSVGKGRVLAFAGDTTLLWRIYGKPNNTDGIEMHARFWKQTMLWLAQQENNEGSVWIKPDFRRLAAGQQQGFSVGVRGKSGLPIANASYAVRVVAPDGNALPVQVRREGEFDRGQFWQTLQPGEYRLEVNANATDTDQKRVEGTSSVRFLVYQDEREMLQTAADLDFLGKLAAAGGGRSTAYRIDDLPDFLDKLKSATLPNEKVKVDRYPDWRSVNLRPFLPLWLILFTIVLCTEWALRRLWGMV